MMKLRHWLNLSLPLLFKLVGCGSAPKGGETSSPKVIIGEKRMVSVNSTGDNIPARYDRSQLLNAIGLMTGNCTAFHLGNGVVATAGHCVQGATAQQTPQDGSPCQNLSIEWGKIEGAQSAGVSRCVQVLDRKLDDKQDYALIQVDPAPAASISIAQSQSFTTSPLTIFGYPKGNPLAWSETCKLTAPEKEEQVGSRILHQCDTEPGNSGSPIIDDTSLGVVAIHDGGQGEWNYGTLLSSTPAQELVDSITSRPLAGAQGEGSLAFGPFENNVSKVLASMPSENGKSVSFTLDLDVEDGMDKVKVSDGNGRVKEYSGKKAIELKNMATPVTVAFYSDYAGESQKVSVDNIQYN